MNPDHALRAPATAASHSTPGGQAPVQIWAQELLIQPSYDRREFAQNPNKEPHFRIQLKQQKSLINTEFSMVFGGSVFDVAHMIAASNDLDHPS